MYQLTNRDKRTIALPAPKMGALLIDVDEAKEISDEHFKELVGSLVFRNAIENGTVGIAHFENRPEPKPDRGIKLVSKPGGWWRVFVNNHEVTDTAVRKEKAEKIADEYK